MNSGQYRNFQNRPVALNRELVVGFTYTSEKPAEMEETDISSLQCHRVTVAVKIITINHKAL